MLLGMMRVRQFRARLARLQARNFRERPELKRMEIPPVTSSVSRSATATIWFFATSAVAVYLAQTYAKTIEYYDNWTPDNDEEDD